jgi:hypothetical protein
MKPQRPCLVATACQVRELCDRVSFGIWINNYESSKSDLQAVNCSCKFPYLPPAHPIVPPASGWRSPTSCRRLRPPSASPSALLMPAASSSTRDPTPPSALHPAGCLPNNCPPAHGNGTPPRRACRPSHKRKRPRPPATAPPGAGPNPTWSSPPPVPAGHTPADPPPIQPRAGRFGSVAQFFVPPHYLSAGWSQGINGWGRISVISILEDVRIADNRPADLKRPSERVFQNRRQFVPQVLAYSYLRVTVVGLILQWPGNGESGGPTPVVLSVRSVTGVGSGDLPSANGATGRWALSGWRVTQAPSPYTPTGIGKHWATT